MFFQQTISFLVYAIILTIPLIFGAVHPIILGCYVALMLIGFGGWLLLNQKRQQFYFPSFWIIVPLLLVIYFVLQSIPLPMDWVESISPFRAERVRMVNELAGTEQLRITISDNGIIGFYRSFFLLSLVFYYVVLRRLFEIRPKFYFTLVMCLIGVGTVEALYGLAQFVNPQIGILWLPINTRAAYGSIIYKNQYASLLNMIWPLAIASGSIFYMKRSRDDHRPGVQSRLRVVADKISTPKIQSPLLIFAGGIMVLAVLFSLSRGGILAMILTALCLILLLPFSRGGKAGFLVVFLCLFTGYGSLLGLDTILARFDTLDASGANRIDIYLSSLPMLVDHWLTGIGVDSYSLLSPVYLKGFPANFHYDRVHNEYIELMIELGVPVAILLFSWMLFGLIKLGLRLTSAMKQANSDHNRLILGVAAFCGLIGFLVHGVADFGWRLPANLVYSVTLLALCAGSMHVELLPHENPEEDQ